MNLDVKGRGCEEISKIIYLMNLRPKIGGGGQELLKQMGTLVVQLILQNCLTFLTIWRPLRLYDVAPGVTGALWASLRHCHCSQDGWRYNHKMGSVCCSMVKGKIRLYSPDNLYVAIMCCNTTQC